MSAPSPPEAPSDRLLRTLASVPTSTPVLNVGCGSGRHAEALLRLGFPMHACDTRPEAVQDTRAIVRDLVDEDTAQSCVQQTSLQGLDDLDATFDWVIVDRTEAYLDGSTDLEPVLQKAHSLLNPGGWLYLTVPAGPGEDEEQVQETALDDVAILFAPEDLSPTQFDIELMECRSPERVEEHGETRLHALYRKVKRARPG